MEEIIKENENIINEILKSIEEIKTIILNLSKEEKKEENKEDITYV